MPMSKIYVVNSDMKNVIGMSETNVMFKVQGQCYQKNCLKDFSAACDLCSAMHILTLIETHFDLAKGHI